MKQNLRGEFIGQEAELHDNWTLELARHWLQLRFIVRTFISFCKGPIDMQTDGTDSPDVGQDQGK